MKAFLMYKDRDFDLKRKLPWNEPALTQDLELNTLFSAMADGDEFMLEVARKAVLLGPENDLATILYRQAILRDCLENSSLVRELYALTVESIERERKVYWGFLREHPDSILHRSLEVLQMFAGMLKKLRHMADEHAGKFESEGFTTLFAMLKRELDDEYLTLVQDHLRELSFRDGVLISAGLGQGNQGTQYILRKPPEKKRTWIEWIFPPRQPGYMFQIADRDETGHRALGDLRARGINLVANALAQSNDHILSFFSMLRAELAFYVGCLNLHQKLAAKGEPWSFPVPLPAQERRQSFTELYDVCLSLRLDRRVVGNDLRTDHENLVLITGANQGGKSTFLRSIGLGQLMMQTGMFAPAESFSANLCERLFTHYKREEDVTMHSGKLDEELNRMSQIVDHLTPNSMLLFNESFAATNEREGSEIARQIVTALLEKRLQVFFVTHLYAFAHSLYSRRMADAVFLRAERQADGGRTFKITEGAPLETSYGEDLYQRIFGAGAYDRGPLVGPLRERPQA